MRKIKSFIYLIYLTVIFISCNVQAADNETVTQLSRITGGDKTRVAKIVEAHEIKTIARSLSSEGKYADAVAEINKVIENPGYLEDDRTLAKVTLFEIHKRAKNYADAANVMREMIPIHRTYKMRYDEAMILLSCQQGKCDHRLMEQFISDYYAVNDAALPPKGNNTLFLAVPVRVYEAAGKIDRALDLVEKYYQLYFPNGKPPKKKLSDIGERKREGVILLKEALLRDKKEAKNIYAQELINTTDYFGFV